MSYKIFLRLIYEHATEGSVDRAGLVTDSAIRPLPCTAKSVGVKQPTMVK